MHSSEQDISLQRAGRKCIDDLMMKTRHNKGRRMSLGWAVDPSWRSWQQYKDAEEIEEEGGVAQWPSEGLEHGEVFNSLAEWSWGLRQNLNRHLAQRVCQSLPPAVRVSSPVWGRVQQRAISTPRRTWTSIRVMLSILSTSELEAWWNLREKLNTVVAVQDNVEAASLSTTQSMVDRTQSPCVTGEARGPSLPIKGTNIYRHQLEQIACTPHLLSLYTRRPSHLWRWLEGEEMVSRSGLAVIHMLDPGNNRRKNVFVY